MADPHKGRATSVWHLLVGPPRSAQGSGKDRITPIEGLSALSLDALTSVAYGPEAIILVLAVAGASALHLVLPVTIAIVALLAILVFSYRQVIDAYPMGGGAYAVSRANLGAHTSLVAAAALVVDYTLTVAVSIAAGVASLESAFPALDGATVPLCLGILLFITVLNLRGLGETARAFLLPTMLFIVGLLAIIAVGFIHPLGLNQPLPGTSQLPTTGLKTVTFLLILKAFSAGCSALTGVEAIANGVPLFREPRAVRAKRTEMLLGLILGAMLLGLAVLAKRWHVGPRTGQTVLSQIMALAVGRGVAYYIVSITITIVLALAANTSFGGLPVLASLVARDNYLPHLFTLRGDRQVFSNGIVVLAVLAGALLIAVRGNTNTLIPLFAIGVFIGFTLSQTGLVVHWHRTRPPGWMRRALINGFGACITAIATIVFLISKFTEGAWVVVIAIPAFVFLFLRIHAYYERARKEFRIDETPVRPEPKYTMVIVPVNRISRLTEHALCEAESLGQEVTAVTVVLRGGDEGATTLISSGSNGGSGIPGFRCTCSTTSTPPSCSRSWSSSTRYGRNTRSIRSSSSSRSSARTSSGTGFCTTRSIWSSRRHCAAARTSWWPGSPCHWRSRRPPAPNLPHSNRSNDASAGAQRPFHTGSRFSMNAVAPSLASSLPNTLGCHSAANARALLEVRRRRAHQLLRGLKGEGPVPGDALGQRHRGIEYLSRRDDLVDQTQGLRTPGVHEVAGQRQLERHGQWDAGAQEHAAAGREQAALDLWQTELRRLGRNHHVTAEQQLESPRDGGRVRRSDDGYCNLPLRETPETLHPLALTTDRAALGKGAEVHAGAERFLTRPREHHGTHLGVVLSLHHAEADGGQELGAERVAGLRTVEPEDQHRPPALGDQHRFGRRLGLAHQATTFLSLKSAIVSAG